jgi:hypothetical protein
MVTILFCSYITVEMNELAKNKIATLEQPL